MLFLCFKIVFFKMEYATLSREKKTLELGLDDYDKKFKQLSEQELQTQSRSFDAVRATLQMSLDEANRNKFSVQSNFDILQINFNEMSKENTILKVYYSINKIRKAY